MRARKNTSDDKSFKPPATPSRSALIAPLAAPLASSLALPAVLGSTPRSVSQPAIVSFASVRWEPKSPLWLVIPPSTRTTTPAASAMNPSSNSTAPTRRGTPWRSAQLMSGAATAATTAAVISGATIASVSDMIQTAATTNRIRPTSSQALRPRSRSQPGVASTPVSWSGSISVGGRLNSSRAQESVEQTGGGRAPRPPPSAMMRRAYDTEPERGS